MGSFAIRRRSPARWSAVDQSAICGETAVRQRRARSGNDGRSAQRLDENQWVWYRKTRRSMGKRMVVVRWRTAFGWRRIDAGTEAEARFGVRRESRLKRSPGGWKCLPCEGESIGDVLAGGSSERGREVIEKKRVKMAATRAASGGAYEVR
ncbi:hypothetical protein Salat_2154800 [Sesamum alatum]|uniref:Uncharacterized protein n=1 Tax=Sesamum alatum TaxID=300844 RepID=A0AAE1Y1S0_9LAMI|nr:hypothetical protein Salat_2154800 [Sesamum alatum]